MHPLIADFEFQANYRNAAFRFQIRLDAASFSTSSTGPLGAAAIASSRPPCRGLLSRPVLDLWLSIARNSGLRIAAPDMQQIAKR
jgi:hypothetical protein